MSSFELARLGSGKSPVAITTATSDVDTRGLTSRHQHDIEARETQRSADEAVLARFGKKQQLTVRIFLQLAVD